MDPARKRKIRPGRRRSALQCCSRPGSFLHLVQRLERGAPALDLQGVSGGNYELTGTVADTLRLTSGDRASIEVAIATTLRQDPGVLHRPDPGPFREGREVIVSGTVDDGTFDAEKDSLITKCPSKFADEAESRTPSTSLSSSPGGLFAPGGSGTPEGLR